MNYAYFSFDTFVQELICEYEFLASIEWKSIRFIKPKEAVYVYVDKDKVEKV